MNKAALKPASKGNSKGESGFTLIEIIVALTIAVMMIAIAIPTLSGLASMNEKSAAQQIIGTIRYLFDQSQLNHTYIRLVFDIDANSYHAEEADNPVALLQKKLEIRDGAVQEPEKEDEEIDEEEERKELMEEFDRLMEDRLEWQGWYNFKEKLRKREVKFQEYKDDLIKERKLPDGVKIAGIFTLSLEKKATAGQVSLFFFPNGFVEPAVIYLSDTEEENIWSIRVEPLTGKAIVYNEEIPLPDFEEEAKDDEELF